MLRQLCVMPLEGDELRLLKVEQTKLLHGVFKQAVSPV
jgi:hypothetical protein